MKTMHHNEKGKSKVIILIALAVVAIGALAYLATEMAGQKDVEAAEIASAGGAENQHGIEPGNPVVAKINGTEIDRLEVVNYINTLPVQVRQLPIEQLFPAAINELINEKLTIEKSAKSKLNSDADILARLEEVKTGLVATAYLKKTLDDKVTEAKLKEAYDLYVTNFPEVEEARVAHILVEEEAKANKLIDELEKGANFADLAKENSLDTGTAQNGGELNYITKAEVVPEFAKAAFSQELGKHSFKPVKSQFGYHIIQVLDKRMRAPASLEEAKPSLENQVRQAALQKTFSDWRENAEITVFDINGKEVEPAAGAEDEAQEAEQEDAAKTDSAPVAE